MTKALFWICGIEKSLERIDHRLEEEEGGDQQQQQQQTTKVANMVDTSIHQDPKWSSVCDASALLAIALSGFFFYAFFNKFD
jgi:hypothetical protein